MTNGRPDHWQIAREAGLDALSREADGSVLIWLPGFYMEPTCILDLVMGCWTLSGITTEKVFGGVLQILFKPTQLMVPENNKQTPQPLPAASILTPLLQGLA